MDRRLILLFISFFFVTLLSAQKNVQDSLFTLIETLPEDTGKVKVYFDYGIMLESISVDSAMIYYKKAKTICDKYNYIKGKVKYASIYSGILNEQGRLTESFDVSMEALHLTEEHHLYYEMAKTCNNLGNVLNYMGEFNEAMVYFLRSAMIFERIDRKEHLNVIYQNIGSVYLSMGNFEKSVEYTQKSIDMSRSMNDSARVSNALTNLAGALISLGRYDEALIALNNCLEISSAIHNSYAINLAYLGLGNLYTQTKQYDKAILVLQEALSTARKMNYTNNLANSLNALSMVYYRLGNYSKADIYASEAVAINEQYNVFINLIQQYKLISEVKANLGQYASAYNYLLKYVTLNDSLSGVEQKRSVDELEKKYQSAEKDKLIYEKNLKLTENSLQFERKDKRIQKINTWLIIASSAVVILVLVLLLVYFINSNRRKLQEQKLQALHKEQEVIRLKATLDGQLQERQRIAREMHDEIGSGLTTILFLSNQAAADHKKTDKIAETSRTLINQMNEIIWSMNTEQDSLEELVSYIRYQSSQLLDSVGIAYSFDVPDEIPDLPISGMQRRNIYLVIKEALHNIIKHSGATNVNIKISFDDGIEIWIEDNGKGLVETGNPFGNGMKNMKYRMEQIGGEWGIFKRMPFILQLKLKKERLV